MAKTPPIELLKYHIRQRYLQHCTREGVRPDFSDFVEKAAEKARRSKRRMERVLNARHDAPLIADVNELQAFAELVGCKHVDLIAVREQEQAKAVPQAEGRVGK